MDSKKQSILKGRKIPLASLFPTSDFELLGVKEFWQYDDDGKRTDKLAGYSYTVVEPMDYRKFSVKVSMSYPVITSEELRFKRNNGERVFVTFVNPTVSLYWNSAFNDYADSFKADSVKVCERNKANVTHQSTSPLISDVSDEEDLGLD